MSTLLCARAASAHVPALRRAQLPAEVQRKTSRPLGANTLTQFAHPSQPVQRKEPPVRGEHANAVRAPRLSGAEKEPPVRANPLKQFVCPGFPVQKRSRLVRANPPAAVRAPRLAGAEKEPPRQGEHADAVRAPRLSGAENPGNPEKIFPPEKAAKRPFSR